MPGQGMANFAQLPGEACSWFPPPPRAQLPDTRTGRWGGRRAERQQQQWRTQWGETPKETAADRGMGVLSVCTLGPGRPSSTDTRHLWEGGMLRKGKGEKSRAAQREREAERGGEWLGERGEEEGSGRLADVTSALNQSLKPRSHGCCPLMPLALLDLPQAATPQSNTCILHKLPQYITAIQKNVFLKLKIRVHPNDQYFKEWNVLCPIFVSVNGHFFTIEMWFNFYL